MTASLASSPASSERAPTIAALVCYVLWGLLPILFIWGERAGAGAFELVAWRTICSLPCAIALVLAAGQGRTSAGFLPGRWGCSCCPPP